MPAVAHLAAPTLTMRGASTDESVIRFSGPGRPLAPGAATTTWSPEGTSFTTPFIHPGRDMVAGLFARRVQLYQQTSRRDH